MFRFSPTPLNAVPEELLRSPLLDGATLEQRQAFLTDLRHVRADPRTVLYNAGEPGDTLWIVVSGTVTLTRETESEQQVELDRSSAGDVFGEMAVISPATRAATATTVTQTELLVLTRGRFRQLIEARDPCAEAILRYATLRICRRLRQADARIDLAHKVKR